MCAFKSIQYLNLSYCKGNQTIATGKTLHKANLACKTSHLPIEIENKKRLNAYTANAF
jgi:hypothetical protein